MNRRLFCQQYKWLRMPCTLALLALSVYGGVRISWKWHGLSSESGSMLSRAVQLAQEEVDRCYGTDAFVYGARRILKDGFHDYYAFQVKVDTGGGMTNLLINVDLTGQQNVVRIDYEAGYSFTGDFAY